MPKYRVTLTEEERAVVTRLVSVGKASARKLTRARILVLADQSDNGPARSDEQIRDALGIGLSTISRVRKRFVLESFEAALNPRPQPRRSNKVKIRAEAEKQLVTLACSEPPEGRNGWTLQLLGDRLVRLGFFESVSRETVRRALKKTTSG